MKKLHTHSNTQPVAAPPCKNGENGFSLLEVLLALTITLVMLGLVGVSFSRVMGTRERETGRTDALTAAQAAINVMSREISNSGYGLKYNGINLTDSNTQKLNFRANIDNSNAATTDAGEDVTYFYDATSKSVVRYDTNTNLSSGIINEVSKVTFQYFDYTDSNSAPTIGLTPTADTGRVRITLIVFLPEVNGQPSNQTVTLISDVTLRNSTYMLNQY